MNNTKLFSLIILIFSNTTGICSDSSEAKSGPRSITNESYFDSASGAGAFKPIARSCAASNTNESCLGSATRSRATKEKNVGVATFTIRPCSKEYTVTVKALQEEGDGESSVTYRQKKYDRIVEDHISSLSFSGHSADFEKDTVCIARGIAACNCIEGEIDKLTSIITANKDFMTTEDVSYLWTKSLSFVDYLKHLKKGIRAKRRDLRLCIKS